jgi:Tetratricopeptide repeat
MRCSRVAKRRQSEAGYLGTIPMRSILRCMLAALAFASIVWFAAMPAAADDFETCGRTSGDQATAACTRAIDSGRYGGPELAFLFSNRCLAWIARQESDKAIEDCSQAIRLDPNDVVAFSNRAVAYQLKGQYDRAITKANTTVPSRTMTRRSGSTRTTQWRSIIGPNHGNGKTICNARWRISRSTPNWPRPIRMVQRQLSASQRC